MASRFEVPDEFKHLVEKRDGDERRQAKLRKQTDAERRKKSRREQDDPPKRGRAR
jgi:hypothetical protein